MNYFYSKNKRNNIKKLVEGATFPSFVEYMAQRQNDEIILRELKKVFPQRKFDFFLDQLIDADLLKRENRRYYLNFPIFNEGECQKEIEEMVEQLLQQLVIFSQEEKQVVMGEEIWHYCFEDETDYFYATTETFNRATKSSAGNETYQFISLNYQETLPVSLANYFYLQKQQLPIPKSFSKLAEAIGDVNEVYYFDQVEVIIDRIQAMKYKTRRPSIFYESLLLSNTVEITNTKEVEKNENNHLVLPVIEVKGKMNHLPEVAKERTPSEKAYIKRKVYDCLVKTLSLGDYSYIQKKL